jgi:hypothetical protein
MDYSKRGQLEQLLGRLEAGREERKQQQRSQRIREATQKSHFDQIKRSVVAPALRDFMLRLENKGHVTRLRQMEHGLRLDFVLDNAPPVLGRIDVERLASVKVAVRCQRGWEVEHVSEITLDELTPAVVADVILAFLRRTLGEK